MSRIIEVFNERDMAYISSAKEIMENAMSAYKENAYVGFYSLPKVFFTEDDKTHIACYSRESKAIYVNSSVLNKGLDYFTQVILHEFAHYVCVNFYGVGGHGAKFKDVCRVINCKFNSPYAKTNENLRAVTDLESKIFKLLRLSESSNVNESASALNKARKLMTRANISLVGSEKIYRVTLYSAKRLTALYSSVSYIVGKALGVHVVNIRGGEQAKIVAHGTHEQLEIACYMFDCLLLEFKKQLEKAKSEYGVRSSMSFYRGMQSTILNTFNKDYEVTTALALSSKDIERIADKLLYRDYHTARGRHSRVNLNDYGQGQIRGGKVSLYKGTYAHDSGKYLN